MTSAKSTQSSEFLAHVEGLRAIAVLMVVIFHFGVSQLAGGFVGVDVFFVISGFLITRNLINQAEQGSVSIRSFYLKRARRLLPALVCTVTATLICSALILSPSHFAATGKSAFFTALSLSNVHFWQETGYFDVSSTFKPLLHTWSLAVEEQFYLVWPWLLLLLLRTTSKGWQIAWLSCLVIVSLLLSQLLLTNFDSAAYFLMPFRAYELVIGSLCAYAVKFHLSKVMQTWGAWIGIVFILAAAFGFNKETSFPGVSALLPTIGAAFIILSSRASLPNRFLGNALLVHVGRISYSIYLVHWPLVVLYSYWLGRNLTHIDTITLLVAAYFLGLAQFRLVEQRFRTAETSGRQKTQSNGVFIVGIFSCLLVVILAGAVIQKNKGFPQRLPEVAQSALTSSRADRQGICSNYSRKGEYIEECHLGQRSVATHSVLMFGDSHAEHLVLGMSEIANENSLYIESHTHSGCPPLWGATRAFNQPGGGGVKRQQSCRTATSSWRALVEQNKPDVVILAARWMNLFEDTEYGPTAIRREYLLDSDGVELSQESARLEFAAALARTVEHIKLAGSKVILVNQIPLAARNLQDCSAVPRLLYDEKRIEDRCKAGITREEALERMRYMRDALKSLASIDVLSFDETLFFCPTEATECITMIDNQPLYRDDNHLTTFGSIVLARLMQSSIQEFVGKH